MRVLVVTVVHHPQDARILHRQIGALVEAGHAVTYAAAWSATGTAPPAHVTPVDLPRASGRRRLRALRAARATVRAHAGGADLVLLHDPELLFAVAGLRRPPTVWDVHEDTVAALADKPWLPAAARPVVRRAVAVAEHAAERRLHLLLAEPGYAQRFRRPHPVAANNTFVPAQVPPPGDQRVVYLGRISTGRGAHELVQVARLLPAGVRLELIGPAEPDVTPLLDQAQRDRLLTWHGFVPNARALPLLDGALAGLSLLRDEPNYRHSRPTKVVEYMAHGVPVITTPNPVAAQIVRRASCGVVVDFGDPAGAAQAVAELAADPARRHALGTAGHRAALTEYNWENSAEGFVKVLERWATDRRRAMVSPGRMSSATGSARRRGVGRPRGVRRRE